MAQLVRETGSDLTPIEHSLELFHQHLKLFSLKGMMGKKGSGKSIIVDTQLQADPGDTKRFHFVPHAFDGKEPIRGQDNEILGNEEALAEFSFDVIIDEVNFALRKKGKMTDQRTVFNIALEHERQIVEQFAQYNEDQTFKIWSGGAVADTLATLELVTEATDRVNGAGRIIQASGPNGSTELAATASDNVALAASISSNDTLSPRLIEDSVIMAKESGLYKLFPLRVGPNNEEFFMLYVSLKSARDLRSHPEWQNHALSIMQRGIGGDLIAAGALGVWDNVIVKASERIVQPDAGSSENFARNLLVGRDASVIAWAQTMDFSEELIDHKRILSSNGSEIRGEAKATFNSVDMGVAQVITASN